MFGFKFIKFDSMSYVVHYKNGKIVKEGRGLSFFYFAPSSSISAIPMGSNDFRFIFNESTSDFQQITVQGQITYKIEHPKQLAEILDFTVDRKGNYKKNDFEKLSQRLINEAQTQVSDFARSLELKNAIKSAKEMEAKISEGMKTSKVVEMLGIEIIGVNVLEVKPTPEMARALEAKTRESLQQEADQATYNRRNFAVEQERKIRESELNTEIAVEEKHMQIAEKKHLAQVAQQENREKLAEMKMVSDIKIEDQRKKLVEMQAENKKKEADADSYVLQAKLVPYKEMDWKKIMAISKDGGHPSLNIALAFRELAENAEKVGNLNITPDLLDSMIQQSVRHK